MVCWSGGVPRLYDVSDGRLVATLKGSTPINPAGLFSSANSTLVTACDDGAARIWDSETGKELRVLGGSVADWAGRDARSTGQAGEDARTTSTGGDARPTPANGSAEASTSPVLSAVFSSDGRRIVTGSADHHARVWNATTGELLADLEGHDREVVSAAFNPDGSRVVTASLDGTVRVWYTAEQTAKRRNVETSKLEGQAANGTPIPGMGRELLILREAAEGGQSEPLRFVTFTPDGDRIIAHTDSTVYEWNAAGYAKPSP